MRVCKIKEQRKFSRTVLVWDTQNTSQHSFRIERHISKRPPVWRPVEFAFAFATRSHFPRPPQQTLLHDEHMCVYVRIYVCTSTTGESTNRRSTRLENVSGIEG